MVDFVVTTSPTGTTAANLIIYTGASSSLPIVMTEAPVASGRWRKTGVVLSEGSYDFKILDQDGHKFATGFLRVGADGNEITTLSEEELTDLIQGMITGDGAIAVTITVVDENDDPVSLADVSVTKGPLYYHAITNEDGEVSFSLDSGDWTVAIYHVSYLNFTPQTFDPSDDPTQQYELEEITTSAPSTPADAIVRATLMGTTGPAEGQKFYARMIATPPGDGVGYVGELFESAAADEDGYAEMEVRLNGEYEFWFDRGQPVPAKVDETPFDAPAMLGAERPQ